MKMKKHFSNLSSKLKLRTSGNQRGFTLIEILITLALMSIVVVGVFVVLNNAYGFTSRADAHETAVNLAEYEMQYVKNRPFATSATSYSGDPSGPEGSEGFDPPVINVQPDPTDPTNLKEQLISVTVTGRKVSYTLQGYKVDLR